MDVKVVEVGKEAEQGRSQEVHEVGVAPGLNERDEPFAVEVEGGGDVRPEDLAGRPDDLVRHLVDILRRCRDK